MRAASLHRQRQSLLGADPSAPAVRKYATEEERDAAVAAQRKAKRARQRPSVCIWRPKATSAESMEPLNRKPKHVELVGTVAPDRHDPSLPAGLDGRALQAWLGRLGFTSAGTDGATMRKIPDGTRPIQDQRIRYDDALKLM